MPIKVFRSDQQGAPVINGVLGTLITALDAILVNGYGQVNVSGITRSGTTATVTTATVHGLATGDSALISGAAQTQYNVEAVITVTSSTVFTYSVVVAGDAPVTPATGTILCRRASAGFAKHFTGTNKAVYRAIDPAGRRHFYRVLDTGATAGGAREAPFAGYATMSDVDTGTDMFPSTAQASGGSYWLKSNTLNAVGKHWVVITDGSTLYHFAYLSTTIDGSGDNTTLDNPGASMSLVGLGDTLAYRPGDTFASMLSATNTTNVFTNIASGPMNASNSPISNSTSTAAISPLVYFPRDFTAVASARTGQVTGTGWTTTIGGTIHIVYPHVIDNGFYITPIVITQGVPSLIRARLPGAYESMHARCFPNGTIIEGIQGYAGRRFMMLYGTNGFNLGCMVIDITGPWDS